MDGVSIALVIVAFLAIIALLITVSALRSSATANREKAELATVNARLESDLKNLEGQAESTRQEASEVDQLRITNAQLSQRLETESELLTKMTQAKEAVDQQLMELQDQFQSLNAEKAGLESDLKNAIAKAEEQAEWVKHSTAEFRAMSSEVLAEQRKSFMDTAKETLEERERAVEQMVKPLAEKIDTLDKSRVESAASLKEQIELMVRSNDQVANEARSLSSALSKPQVRGAWGEMQVERVLELAGLQKGIHYTTQDSDQKGGRTDFIVHLPHDRDIILDSKVVLSALQEAGEAKTDDVHAEKLKRHAVQMRSYAENLGSKEYWSNLPETADFVVMVVPEFALAPAVEREPALIERALENKVVIATYSTLVALLKCVAMSWQERNITDEAHEIGRLGRDLHDRLAVFAKHLAAVGQALDTAVSHYNSSVGSFDGRLLPQARRFLELGVGTTREMPTLNQIDQNSRRLQSAEAR